MYEPKTQTRAAGAGLIFLGIYLNIPFSILSAVFQYPDVLRAPTGEILEAFQKGGPGLIAVWYSFTFAALAMVCVVKLFERVEWGNQADLLKIGTTFGVVGGFCKLLDLSDGYPFELRRSRLDAQIGQNHGNQQISLELSDEQGNLLAVANGSKLLLEGLSPGKYVYRVRGGVTKAVDFTIKSGQGN